MWRLTQRSSISRLRPRYANNRQQAQTGPLSASMAILRMSPIPVAVDDFSSLDRPWIRQHSSELFQIDQMLTTDTIRCRAIEGEMSTATILKFGRVLKQEFEQVFRDYSKFIYRTAYSVTGNHADA